MARPAGPAAAILRACFRKNGLMMIEHENRSFPASSTGFLRDEASQLLVLKDAIEREHGPAICQAFAEVAHSRGVAQIASVAGVSTTRLREALANPDRPDLILLGKVVEALSGSGSSSRTPGDSLGGKYANSEKMEKTSAKIGKT